jgi:hypothetical protein
MYARYAVVKAAIVSSFHSAFSSIWWLASPEDMVPISFSFEAVMRDIDDFVAA